MHQLFRRSVAFSKIDIGPFHMLKIVKVRYLDTSLEYLPQCNFQKRISSAETIRGNTVCACMCAAILASECSQKCAFGCEHAALLSADVRQPLHKRFFLVL